MSVCAKSQRCWLRYLVTGPFSRLELPEQVLRLQPLPRHQVLLTFAADVIEGHHAETALTFLTESFPPS